MVGFVAGDDGIFLTEFAFVYTQTVRDPDERFDLIHRNFPGVVYLQVIRELKTIPGLLKSVTFSWGRKPSSQIVSPESADAKLEWASKHATGKVSRYLLQPSASVGRHNHSPRFYGLLDRFMPEWRLVKEQLEGRVELFLSFAKAGDDSEFTV